MKIKILFLLMIIYVLIVAGCKSDSADNTNAENYNENQVETSSGNAGNINSDDVTDNDEDGKIKANIQIAHATDELLQRLETPLEYVVDENGGAVLIWADNPIKDFAFFEVGHEFESENFTFFVDTILYSVDELPQGKPFMVKMYMPEILPMHGISYTIGDIEKRYFSIHESGMDGSLFLLEFEND